MGNICSRNQPVVDAAITIRKYLDEDPNQFEVLKSLGQNETYKTKLARRMINGPDGQESIVKILKGFVPEYAVELMESIESFRQIPEH